MQSTRVKWEAADRSAVPTPAEAVVEVLVSAITSEVLQLFLVSFLHVIRMSDYRLHGPTADCMAHGGLGCMALYGWKSILHILHTCCPSPVMTF